VWRWEPGAYAERSLQLTEIAEREGRDPATVHRSLGLYTLVGDDQRDLVERYRALQRWTPGGALDGEPMEDYARGALVGTPEQCLEQLGRFAEAGVEEFIVGAASMPFGVFDWSMLDLIGEEVIPAARDL
jgi:alkanesulfonate monooxygenase SsuD/methylene tetrahydromethanopterin reductase-like flavin-dependent oxidoreductase (luciferase family)